MEDGREDGFPVHTVCSLPIFEDQVPPASLDLDQASEVCSRCEDLLPDSSAAAKGRGQGIHTIGLNSGNSPAESGESMIKADPRTAGWIRSDHITLNALRQWVVCGHDNNAHGVVPSMVVHPFYRLLLFSGHSSSECLARCLVQT